MFATLRQCLEILPAGTRARWAAMVPIAVGIGLLEAGAAAVVLGLIRIVSDPSGAAALAPPAIAARLPESPSAIVLTFTALAVAYLILKNLLIAGSQYIRDMIVATSRARISAMMLRGYLASPYAWHVARNSADLRRNIAVLPNAVCDVLMSSATLLSEALVATGLSVVLLWAAPVRALAAGGIVAVLVLGTLRWTKARAGRVGRIGHELGVQIDQVVQQALGGFKELKVLGRQATFDDRFQSLQQRSIELGAMSTTLTAVPPLLIETCFVVGALVVIAVSAVNGAAGPDGLPLLAVFTYSGFRLIPAINRMTWRVNTIRAHAAAVQTLHADFVTIAPFASEARATDPRRSTWSMLSLSDVSFRYDGPDATVLHDVSLDIHRGDTLGIVGVTGAGKTTLIDVVLGLLPPTQGRVIIKGDNADAGPRVAYVPQSVFVADDSLCRNVAFAVSDAAIDHGRLQQCLAAAQLAPVVAQWPAGVDTVLGERGARLSGGERQRVGIARALYHQPDLLVLDEATAALDSVTEGAIMQTIADMRITTIIVAHRLSTLGHCDRLVFIEHGRIIASGSFDDLMRTSPAFRQLVEAANTGAPERA